MTVRVRDGLMGRGWLEKEFGTGMGLKLGLVVRVMGYGLGLEVRVRG